MTKNACELTNLQIKWLSLTTDLMVYLMDVANYRWVGYQNIWVGHSCVWC